MIARKRLLAAKREEILGYVDALQRRRGLESSIELGFLADVLGIKFSARKKDMLWFISKVLTDEERAQFRVLGGPALTLKKVREQDQLKRQAVAAETQRKRDERNLRRLECMQARTRRLQEREAKRAACARLDEQRKARKELDRVQEKVQTQAKKDLQSGAKPETVKATKSPPAVAPVAKVKAVPMTVGPHPGPKRAKQRSIDAAVERAVKVLKGSMEINNSNVVFRAALYCDVKKEKIARYVQKLSKERRKELGFADAVDAKRTTTVPLRPRPPCMITRNIS